MASTGAVVYVRPRFSVTVVPHGVTGAVVYIPFRTSTGIYTSTGVQASRDYRNKKALKPDNSVPISLPNGLLSPMWARWFEYMNREFLAMPDGPTLPDVVSTLTVGQVNALIQSQVNAALTQMAEQNAQVLASVKTVLQTSALPGADQVQSPILTPDYGSGAGGSGE